ncbi:MAG: hypothetical protein KDI09_13120 [Halioglobus sp.]|nr:hypothetical protein [Halioglobus sp.]
MTQAPHPAAPTVRQRTLWLVVLIALPLVGWSGFLDTVSTEQLNGSISSAGLVYGTARGINALVSLLQGTEFTLPFVTVSIGEVLDPVNDLIERFSNIILLALGSLALQKILLALVSDTLFNVVLSITALCTALSLSHAGAAMRSNLLRLFIAVAFLRFSLGVVVLANGWVDARFLNAADVQRHAAMERFEGELREVENLSTQKGLASAQLDQVQTQIEELESAHAQVANDIAALNLQIAAARSNLDALREQAGGLCKATTLDASCPDDVVRASDALKRLLAQRDTEAGRGSDMRAATEALREEKACLEKRSRGESCGLLDRIPTLPDKRAINARLEAINANLSDFAENSINLLVSLLLKTVAIPLAFAYLLLWLTRQQWARV